jgi:hypothetical protein
MEDNTKQELDLRRRAIRLKLKGLRPAEILRRIPRGRTWLFRWLKRFARSGWPGLKNKSKQPKRSPHAYPLKSRTLVRGLSRAMAKRRLGLLGARAIQAEIRQQKLLPHNPSVAAINRWLRAAGLCPSPPPAPTTVFYPEPQVPPDYVLHAMDWTARYLEGGQKVFAFHTVSVVTRALAQTIASDKTGTTLHQHLWHAWQSLGLPDGLQLDNDVTFTGGERTLRRFGAFVRLCLYLGIELVFVPPAEPRRNGVGEGVNSLWARSFWNRYRCRSLQAVVSRSPQFVTWYMTQYHPPSLQGKTPAQAPDAPDPAPNPYASSTTAHHRWPPALYSAGLGGRRNPLPGRNLESRQTVCASICLGDREHPDPARRDPLPPQWANTRRTHPKFFLRHPRTRTPPSPRVQATTSRPKKSPML